MKTERLNTAESFKFTVKAEVGITGNTIQKPGAIVSGEIGLRQTVLPIH